MHEYLTAEIFPSAIAENLAMIRRRLSPGVRLCAVVKADGYGLGVEGLLEAVARSADQLAVAAPVEAVQLRRLGYQGEVLVFFSPCAWADAAANREALEELIRLGVTLTAVSAEEVAAIAEAAGRAGAPAQVHIKIDSGMGRSGVLPDAAPEIVAKVRSAEGLRLTGLYTHFATADEPDKAWAREQLKRFRGVAEAVGGRGQLLLHAANSAAAIDLPESHLDMVRVGLAMYGYQPAERMENPVPLRPALRVWGRLMLVKRLPAGAGVGYGLTCTLKRPSVVGLAPVGYADGYFRSLSNRATMRVRGADAPVLGRVSMDQVVIDLTDAPPVSAGEPVEVISRDPSAPHSVENLARLAGTIPYEITCRLGPRAKRILVS